jgi:branched-chain amino acid transport system permease protein
MGSPLGAFLAALLLAELQAFGIIVLPGATLVLSFLVMAVVLALRPHGLLGRAETHRETRAWPLLRRPSPAARAATWAALALALAAPLALGPFGLSVATEMLIAMLFAAALHLLMGPGGIASFGHAAWFGLGAYAASGMVHALAAPMPLGLLAAPLAAGLAAWAFGALVARLEGIYLAMLTLALAQIAWAAASQWDFLGGDNGILGIWPDAWARGPVAFYLLALVLCAGGVAALRRAILSPFGYALRACRDAPARAEALGLAAPRLRAAAFALSGAAAGLAGGLAAYSKGSVFPTLLALPRSVDGLLMVLLGGVDTLAGPILGALAYTGLADTLMRATDFWRAGLGAVILVLVLACPDGIAGRLAR